ncbi:cyclic nucleotide-binding domain-containing protein [Nodosilinea sp. LEGE 07298]|jgi:CRP-like cAMP-binding protein|uniref:cyclic nucleotide-binding domain-containing protein n=1 Tax=Nodosilinea sp. LEGE 07298 TaxID=2777970 RepID=UPI001880E623|nr:cyclic nucleotide-binding domain-containing protein [Nodosilinea sp. LEGE 07298]MBE9109532.1 cyclic nucleotide-binding domain-containing protein [Nodosilinea sp. LEGE 07298]
MSVPFAALLQGLLGASSLLVGAVLGIAWRPARSLTAAIMAFGSGTLLSAIAYDITLPAFRSSGFLPLVIGFALGGTLFTVIVTYIDNQGGFIRHPSSSRRFLYHHRQDEASEVLDRIGHIEMLHSLSPAEMQAIIPLLKPLQVEPGTVLCLEGAPGDSMFLIVEGEAEIFKGPQRLAALGAGEMFGEMALLTGEERSATVRAKTPMELYELDKTDFDAMLTYAPQLSSGLSRILARRLRETTQSTAKPVLVDDDQWRRQVLDSVEVDIPISEQQFKELAQSSAPLAILVGTLIDNIPEALVIGFHVGTGHTGASFLMAVFISNIPEAMSSSIGMRQAGTSAQRILALWCGAVLLSGLMAMVGGLMVNVATDWMLAVAQATAGGAILAMIASTMMPEAYEMGGGSVTFSTIAGFLVSFYLASSAL